MPGTASPRRDEMRHEEWLTLFSDRERPRAIIGEFLRDLASAYSQPRFPVLQFYGVSGQGKSSLFYNTQSDASKRYPDVRFAFLDLADLNPTRVSEPVEVLWYVAHALANGGIMAPLTLCLYAHYWRKQNAGQEFRLEDTPLKEYLERCIRGCEILSPFSELIHLISDVGQAAFKTIAIFDKCWGAARSRAYELRIADLRRDEPGSWSPERIEGAFPEFLALDILAHLKTHGDQKVCLALDTFERLEPGAKGDGCERAFQDLCSRLVDPRDESGEPSRELRGRAGVLLFGREKLRWERYDLPGTRDPWPHYIETQALSGFTKPDAQAFLRTDYAEFWTTRAPEVVEGLRRYEEAILVASDEEASDERESGSTYLPYYLRLAGEMIYEQAEHFVPEMLGHSPDEMQQRFIKYLPERSPEKFSAIRTLALALYFDDDLFDYLVQRNHIRGIPVHGMVPALLSNRSYVRRFEADGRVTYRFHRHMQQALLDDLGKSPEDVEMAGNAIEAILEYYAARAAFSTPAEFRVESHLPAYEHGMDVLLTHAEKGWVSLGRAGYWRGRLEKPFDEHTATAVRVRVWERAVALWSARRGFDHPDTAYCLNELAHLYEAQGRYEETEPLYQRALAIWEKTFGPDHPYTAAGLNNLAGLYKTQGRYEEAEPLHQRALAISKKVLGPDHPHTAQSLNNLAVLYNAQDRYGEAEPLYRRALAIREKALGPDHPDTANCLNNLAELYRAQGRYEEAEPLLQRALAILKKALGPDHPHTAHSLNNLAGLYDAQGRYEEAEPLLQRALAIRERAPGPDHPDTATSLSNLAWLYYAQGRYEEAEPLLQRALAIDERMLGPDHPDTARSLNNMALLYDSQGRYEEAKLLYRRALAVLEKALGPNHPSSATARGNYAALLRTRGRNAEADRIEGAQ
jgi:tetratricopeptide (TPR) repeat protein